MSRPLDGDNLNEKVEIGRHEDRLGVDQRQIYCIVLHYIVQSLTVVH